MATIDSLIPEHVPISEAPRDVAAIAEQERAHFLPYWNSNVAFQLGCALRTRLLTFEKPVVIDISTVSEPGHTIFRTVSTSIIDCSKKRRELWLGSGRCIVGEGIVDWSFKRNVS